VRVSTDPSAAEWVAVGTNTLQSRAGGFVPAAYPSYARILHSVGIGDGLRCTWRAYAEVSRNRLNPDSQWQDIVEQDEELVSAAPRRGSLSVKEAASLAGVLARFTKVPDQCFFGLWEGWARTEHPPGPRFESSKRAMTLWEGTVADASLSFEPSPGQRIANLWWPADHAWFVTTEIDFDSTIVAGSPSCIKAVASDSGLEVFEISADLNLTRKQHPPDDSLNALS